ncbi:MAG TPA: hypothetical protein PKM23_16060, partial [bacterium]|nr:hypothetical protein [bacterium]
FNGLEGGRNANQTPVRAARVVLPAAAGSRVHFLPFLGQVQILPEEPVNGMISCTLPEFQRGAILWVQ